MFKSRMPKFENKEEERAFIKKYIGIDISNITGVVFILGFPWLSIALLSIPASDGPTAFLHTGGWFFWFGMILWAAIYFLGINGYISMGWKSISSIVFGLWLVLGGLALFYAFFNEKMFLNDQALANVSFWSILLIAGICWLVTKRAAARNPKP
jgi:hypothetical protein